MNFKLYLCCYFTHCSGYADKDRHWVASLCLLCSSNVRWKSPVFAENRTHWHCQYLLWLQNIVILVALGSIKQEYRLVNLKLWLAIYYPYSVNLGSFPTLTCLLAYITWLKSVDTWTPHPYVHFEHAIPKPRALIFISLKFYILLLAQPLLVKCSTRY